LAAREKLAKLKSNSHSAEKLSSKKSALKRREAARV
jgi:hypothetical protein